MRTILSRLLVDYCCRLHVALFVALSAFMYTVGKMETACLSENALLHRQMQMQYCSALMLAFPGRASGTSAWASWLGGGCECSKVWYGKDRGVVVVMRWPCGWEVSLCVPFAACRTHSPGQEFLGGPEHRCRCLVRSRDHAFSSYSHQHIPPPRTPDTHQSHSKKGRLSSAITISHLPCW